MVIAQEQCHLWALFRSGVFVMSALVIVFQFFTDHVLWVIGKYCFPRPKRLAAGRNTPVYLIYIVDEEEFVIV